MSSVISINWGGVIPATAGDEPDVLGRQILEEGMLGQDLIECFHGPASEATGASLG